MVWSLLLFLLWGPLFLAAFVLAIVALAQRRIGHGVSILLLSILIPVVLGMALGAYRTSELMQQVEQAQKQRRPGSQESAAVPSGAAGSEKQPKAEAAREPSALEHARAHVDIYDVKAAMYESRLDGRIPGVEFKLKNNGDRSYRWLQVTFYFEDANGNTISEESYSPVNESSFDSNSRRPLKPGYVWQPERGKFMTAKSVPNEWKVGAVRYEITKAQFSKDEP